MGPDEIVSEFAHAFRYALKLLAGDPFDRCAVSARYLSNHELEMNALSEFLIMAFDMVSEAVA